MREIYNYIVFYLKAKEQAKNLINNILDRINELSVFPRMYATIEKYDENDKIYHKMAIKNYIILYTIDEENKKVFISHMFYSRRNYLYIL